MYTKVICLVALLVVGSQARIFSRCELARELQRQDATLFSDAQISDWVCLVEHESSRNTAAKGGPNSNGSYDYGLFQINDDFWCGTSGPAKDCNVACSALLDDSITDDCRCAKIIYNRHGFSAWYGWLNYCQGSIPNVPAECGL